MSKGWYPVIDYDKCVGCMVCNNMCKHGVYKPDEEMNKPKVVYAALGALRVKLGKELNLIEQFNEVKTILEKKWPNSKYIGYFQANTNTYAKVDVLKENERYLSEDGNLLKANVYSDAITMNKNLIEILLKNEFTKEKFFTKVNSNYVFDKQIRFYFYEFSFANLDPFSEQPPHLPKYCLHWVYPTNQHIVTVLTYPNHYVPGRQ